MYSGPERRMPLQEFYKEFKEHCKDEKDHHDSTMKFIGNLELNHAILDQKYDHTKNENEKKHGEYDQKIMAMDRIINGNGSDEGLKIKINTLKDLPKEIKNHLATVRSWFAVIVTVNIAMLGGIISLAVAIANQK